MWAYRLVFALGGPLRLHERVTIREETDPALRRLVADRYFHRGRRLRAQGRMDAALEALFRGAFIDREYAPVHAAAGDLLLNAGRALEAISWLERAVEIDPARAAWQLLVGQAFELTGRLSPALHAYQNAARLDPTSAEALAAMQRLGDILEERARLADRIPWWLAGSGPR